MTTRIAAGVTCQFGLLSWHSGTYTHHVTAGLSIELTEHLNLDLTAGRHHNSTPQIRGDGTTPLPHDFRFIVGMILEL